MSRERLDQFRRELSQWGVSVPDGDDVEVTGPFGVKLRAVFEETAQILTISIIEKPVVVPESQIWKFVDAASAGLS